MWGKCGTHRVTGLHCKRRSGKFAKRPFPRTARDHQHVRLGFNSPRHHQLVGPGWLDDVEEGYARIAVFKKVETRPIKIGIEARGHFRFALRVQSLVWRGHLLNPPPDEISGCGALSGTKLLRDETVYVGEIVYLTLAINPVMASIGRETARNCNNRCQVNRDNSPSALPATPSRRRRSARASRRAGLAPHRPRLSGHWAALSA